MSFLATTYSSSNNKKFQRYGNSTTKSCKSRNPLHKRISSRVNNSFKLNLSSKIFKNSRSVSRDRTHNFSMENITPNNRRSASIHIYGLNTSGKLHTVHSGLKDIHQSKEYRLKNELISS